MENKNKFGIFILEVKTSLKTYLKSKCEIVQMSSKSNR